MSPPRFPLPLLLRVFSAAEVKLAEAKAQLYALHAPFQYDSPAFGTIEVPFGFVTDFASIPRLVWNIISPEDPIILFGSVVHDFLYTKRGALPGRVQLDRAQCDAVLREAMLLCGAPSWKAASVFYAVRLGGGSHWK